MIDGALASKRRYPAEQFRMPTRTPIVLWSGPMKKKTSAATAAAGRGLPPRARLANTTERFPPWINVKPHPSGMKLPGLKSCQGAGPKATDGEFARPHQHGTPKFNHTRC